MSQTKTMNARQFHFRSGTRRKKQNTNKSSAKSKSTDETALIFYFFLLFPPFCPRVPVRHFFFFWDTVKRMRTDRLTRKQMASIKIAAHLKCFQVKTLKSFHWWSS